MLLATILVFTLTVTMTNSLIHQTNASTTHNVIISNLAFNPQNLTIGIGDTVSWLNNDPLIYTLWFTNASDGSTYLLSIPILPGESWACAFNESMTLQYYSFERLWITGFINIQAITPISGVVGITGYKLLFKETMDNSLSFPAAIDYYWSFSVDRWDGTKWVASGISGSSPTVLNYVIPALATVDLPYYVYVLPSSGPNTVTWNDWLRVNFTFHWTYSSTSYSTDYSAKLHVHPPDIAGGANVAPYYGSDGNVGPPDLGVISPNWKKTVTGGTDPTSNLARADIDGDNYIGPADLGKLSARWKQTWTNTPPPG
jgi:plastocyanin